ncbi:ATP-binding protein [Streptomyces iconiensis]|uniref:ATP-binding protein n=1 Tax=Streptomyces iconiensis TaxID=1384038 RepID=A0ABT7AAR1_9ACTN|nr:ATP-binding protein [Streptomyces iconiensis]MDJ1138084.1 ATP-binding protein [Streptomyces iconiensis]
MADHQEATITLPSAPASVTAARRYVTDVVTQWGMQNGSDAVESLRLIISELATNAVQHTRGQSPTFTIDLRLEGAERLNIGVTDSHPRRPQRLPAAVQQDNGRGLVIVKALTVESGGELTITPTQDGGKTVWVALPWTPVPAN